MEHCVKEANYYDWRPRKHLERFKGSLHLGLDSDRTNSQDNTMQAVRKIRSSFSAVQGAKLVAHSQKLRWAHWQPLRSD